MTNQTIRVLELLKRFNNGQKVCIESLKYEMLWEGKSEKTIRRDLDVIKLVFPESFELIRGEKGCYKAITKKMFDQFLDERNLSLLIQTFSIAQRSDLFQSLDIDKADKSIIESKLKETKKLYEFKTKPFESQKNDYAIMKELERVIYHQKYISIKYMVDNQIEAYEVKPYKIVFMKENFYLACEIDNNNFTFTLYRISKIKEIKDSNKTFCKNLEIEDFIKFMQTPFARYQKGFRTYLIKIVLEVHGDKAYFFKSKKFLNSQTILEEKENGSLTVSYEVTQEIEIEELIKKWLPYVRVIEPLSLKNKLEDELKAYLLS
ncbi:MAG: Probable transcription regulator Cj0571 [uncultured Sulfurovum sp.]|uniref:Probable transcription regulator Cj0571 n=1 Tax=uncultured Sulfurovum sp. TaxID=269237 RepID=A0A6S6UCS3_9BACT|nr:MAG: Probable transcription regulator Cj0571 [uncultured Sulfurovum sp.]